MPSIDQELTGRLLSCLRELSPHDAGQEGRLEASLAALVGFARERGLLAADTPKKLPLHEATAVLLEALQSPPPTPRTAPALPELRFFHPCIHVEPGSSFYSFYAPHGPKASPRLLSIDASGQVTVTSDLAAHLPHQVAALERAAAACPAQLSNLPDALRSAAARTAALARLKREFPAGLPFASPLHMRRLRVWCLLSYLFPLLERTPFLRVRVPDIRSARHVEDLLEQCCWHALSVHRGDMQGLVARHRRVFAGTVIVGPEVKSGRLPRAALELLEDLPASRRLEPPVAFVECYGDFVPPRVPEGWIVDVALPSSVDRVSLPDDWRHLGCALALHDDSALVREAQAHPGGVAEWLHRWLFGDLLRPAADDDDGFALRSGELAARVEQVWADCLAQSDGDPPALQCNVPCLHQRLLERFPDLKDELGSEGWTPWSLRRRLMEQGVATYGVSNLGACLSKPRSSDWHGRNLSGVEVPAYRLPAVVG